MSDGIIFPLALSPNTPFKLGSFGLEYKVVIINFMYVSQSVTLSRSGGRPMIVNIPAVTALEFSAFNIDQIATNGTLGGYLITGPFMLNFQYVSLNLGFGQSFSANGLTGTSLVSLNALINTLVSMDVTFIDEMIISCAGADFSLYGNSFPGNGFTLAVGQTFILRKIATKGIQVLGSASTSSISIFGNNAAINSGSNPSFIFGANP